MRSEIYAIVNEIVETMGFYPVKASTTLLNSMARYNFAILFIGLVFSIVIILEILY